MRRLALACAAAAMAAGVALAGGCGGEEASRPEPLVPPRHTPPPTVATADAPSLPLDDVFDASTSTLSSADAGGPARASLPEPSFGAGSVKPGDPQPFRVAAALRAMRASKSGVKVLKLFSVTPAVLDAKVHTGVDPFADGEWLLVYGSAVEVPGPNANVVKHAQPEAQVARAIADAGMERFEVDAGTASRAELFGVRDVLLRPQAGVMALVPGDRARDLAVALAKPVDPGVKAGELARVFVAEPAKLAHMLPAEIVRANVIVKPAADGGLDASAEADCPDAASCMATATALTDLAKRQNSIMVRIVLQNLLANLAVRADGTKLRATLHADPQQVDAVLNLLRAQLNLPGADPSDQTHR